MEIVLKTREELGLTESASANALGTAKELFKGLRYVLNVRKGKRPSMTFIDDVTNKSATVTVEETLEDAVRSGKITEAHLMGFTILRGDNEGLYFVAPKVRAGGNVDDVVVQQLDAVSYNELAGY
jgi:hypothetical protein